MNFLALPDDWPAQRETMRRIATHVVAQAQAVVTGNFALVVLPGGFGTPQFGDDRQRVRIAGGSLFVERVNGTRNGEPAATTDAHMIAGSTIRSLCNAMGFEPDPDFSVGHDTPPLGDPDEMLVVGSDTTAALGDWWGLGQRAMDIAIASFPEPQAAVSRLWPEHFDVGTDLAVDPANKPGVRTNIGAAAGDEAHQEPYLYVAPWGPDRPGDEAFWNLPFGATLSFGELDASDNPLGTAAEFLLRGIAYLRM
ncbi:MAG: hypothetical protein AB8G14_15200 [Ilumatobacter sp.]